jgi:hypothetical protein
VVEKLPTDEEREIHDGVGTFARKRSSRSSASIGSGPRSCLG